MDLTRYMDISLKPIPRHCPIPPSSVACLEARYFYDDSEAETMFVVCKNNQEIVIAGPPLKTTPEMEGMRDYDVIQILNKRFAEYYTIIEDLIPTIEFGLVQHAQLVPDPHTEGYQIVLDYAKRLRQVSCPAWAPMIPLEEIEFTVWASSDRRGMWRGKEVDVFYACDDTQMWRLNRSMYSLRRIDGLDLTFELYGHLVNSDGVIVGIVTEAAWGRMVRPSDKEFIASELRRLESYGCVYRGVWCNHLIIADGKLRLLQWLLTKHYTDPEELKRDAAMYHTEYLDTLCQEMEDFGPIGHYRFLPDFLTTSNELIKFLRHSIPRYPSTTMLFVYNQERPGFRAVIHYGDDSHDIDENDLPMQITSLRARNPQRNPLRLIHSGSRRGDGSHQNDGDEPLSSSHRLRQPVFLSTWHPYHARSTSGRTSRALTHRHSSESDADTVNEI